MKRKTLYVKGMHCASCNILVEDKFCEVKNVRGVKADFRNQTAIVSYKGHLDKEVLNDTIKLHGYKIANPSSIQEDQEPFLSRLIQSSAFFVIFLILFFFAQELKLLPSFSASAGLSLTVVFILGLVASTSTCMATSGALFLSTIGKFNSGQTSVGENLIPAISFNVGRILSYGFFGLLVGFLGKSAAQSFQLGPLLMGFVAISMVFIGLDMMKLFSFRCNNVLTSLWIYTISPAIRSWTGRSLQKFSHNDGVCTWDNSCTFGNRGCVIFYKILFLSDVCKSDGSLDFHDRFVIRFKHTVSLWSRY